MEGLGYEVLGGGPQRVIVMNDWVSDTSSWLPVRPYLAWLRLQRAAAAIVAGTPLATAALDAGFADAAHMSRTFRRMLGMAPSMLRPLAPSSAPARAR